MFKDEENSFGSGFYFYMNLLAPRGRGGGGWDKNLKKYHD